jgi:hypothetical protein
VTRLRITDLRTRRIPRPHRRPHLWANRPHRARFVSLLGVAVDASATTGDMLRMAVALHPPTDDAALAAGLRRWFEVVHSL